MNLIKKFFRTFAPIEVIVLATAVTISTFLTIPLFTANSKPEILESVFPDAVVYNIHGGKAVNIFDTSFYLRYEKSNDTVINELIKTLNEELIPHHKLFDRHNDYFAVEPRNPALPTAEERTTLPRIKNLKYLNDHKGEVVEIAKPLYDLLVAAKAYSINTPQNAFNMFIGDIYDFWSPHIGGAYNSELDPLYNEARRNELRALQSYIPLTAEDINATLKLWTENGKYYATLYEFNNSGPNLSISVGALAKGLMTDILAAALTAKGLVNGYINGGTSSMTFLKAGIFNKPMPIKLPDLRFKDEFSARFSRPDQYAMSTSGIYAGGRFIHEGREIIRSHIVDPITGYPAQHSHQFVNVNSSTLSGLELDYLTTTLTVLTVSDGVAFLNEKYATADINVIYGGLDDNGYFLVRNNDFPSKNAGKIEVNSAYRESFLDFL